MAALEVCDRTIHAGAKPPEYSSQVYLMVLSGFAPRAPGYRELAWVGAVVAWLRGFQDGQDAHSTAEELVVCGVRRERVGCDGIEGGGGFEVRRVDRFRDRPLGARGRTLRALRTGLHSDDRNDGTGGGGRAAGGYNLLNREGAVHFRPTHVIQVKGPRSDCPGFGLIFASGGRPAGRLGDGGGGSTLSPNPLSLASCERLAAYSGATIG
jgi:hypothetical protein